MKDEALRRLREVAHNFGIKRDQTAGVAVSGGSDSLAMLFLLHDAGWSLEAATVDHGLRPEAAEEAAFVARVCAELGVPHATLKVDLSGASGNLQDNARRARYAALRGWAVDRGIGHVALGHTMDDQAETFLMRLARGSGIDGLSGMSGWQVDGDLVWVRPFLDIRREDLRGFLKTRGVSWIDDPSNDDEGFERVRMRKALGVLEPLGLTAEKLRDTAGNLSDVRLDLDLRAKAAFMAAGEERAGDIILHFPDFREAAGGHEVLRRSFAAALRWVSGADYPPRSDALLDLIAGLRKGETRTLHGCVVSSGRDARITREYNAVKDLNCSTDQLWDGRWSLQGPHSDKLEIRALGAAVKDTPWRDTGLPRQSLLASPAIWQGETLVAAPVAGLANGWTAEATGRGKFADFLISR
ncbi:MAG: tRNA lysidine(34) synthetase TilS [Pseudomonadota bacterium]